MTQIMLFQQDVKTPLINTFYRSLDEVVSKTDSFKLEHYQPSLSTIYSIDDYLKTSKTPTGYNVEELVKALKDAGKKSSNYSFNILLTSYPIILGNEDIKGFQDTGTIVISTKDSNESILRFDSLHELGHLFGLAEYGSNSDRYSHCLTDDCVMGSKEKTLKEIEQFGKRGELFCNHCLSYLSKVK